MREERQRTCTQCKQGLPPPLAARAWRAHVQCPVDRRDVEDAAVCAEGDFVGLALVLVGPRDLEAAAVDDREGVGAVQDQDLGPIRPPRRMQDVSAQLRGVQTPRGAGVPDPAAASRTQSAGAVGPLPFNWSVQGRARLPPRRPAEGRPRT